MSLPPPPVLLPAALIFPLRGLATVSSPIKAWSMPPPVFPPPTNVVMRQYLNGYSGGRVKTPKRRFCTMLQKFGGGTFVIPDAKGTGTFVTISCQSNHMNWSASMILAGSIGLLGVSSIIWGAITRRAGHHSSLSVLLRGCSGPLCTSYITENICYWRTHSVPDLGKRNPSFA